MQRKAQHSFWLAAALVPLLALGAGSVDDKKEVDDGLDMYFREGDLLALTNQSLPVYPDTAAGESMLLERDFPDAPPQIPHSVEDMYPIRLNDNECIECHLPENTTSAEDAPLPETHFRSAVMGKGKAGDPMVWVVKDYKQIKDVVGGRYNCNMCHTPQASNVATPNSLFVSTRKNQK